MYDRTAGPLELHGAAEHVERALTGEEIDALRERRDVVVRGGRGGRGGGQGMRHVRLREGS